MYGRILLRGLGRGLRRGLAATGMAFNSDFDNSAADIWNFIAPFSITVVPEPTTGLLLGMGLGILGVVGRRRTRRM